MVTAVVQSVVNIRAVVPKNRERQGHIIVVVFSGGQGALKGVWAITRAS